MKKVWLFLFFLLSSNMAFSDLSSLIGDPVTGRPKLACEAIICLSTGSPPGECSSSLSEYYNIDFKDWDDTFDARMDFLALCPAAKDGSIDSGYRALLVNGTYQSCHKADLLARLNAPGCSRDEYCFGKTRLNKVPGQCKALSNHGWTIEYPMPTKINPDGQCFESRNYDDGYGYMRRRACSYRFNGKCYTLRRISYFDDDDGRECRSFWN